MRLILLLCCLLFLTPALARADQLRDQKQVAASAPSPACKIVESRGGIVFKDCPANAARVSDIGPHGLYPLYFAGIAFLGLAFLAKNLWRSKRGKNKNDRAGPEK
jgi:hypothetical protein